MSDDKTSRRDLLFFWRRKPEPEPEAPKLPDPPDAAIIDDDEDPIFEKPAAPPPRARGPRALPGDPWLRPPGARPEAEFLAACTKCGKCVEACGANAIFLLPEPLGTPAI